MKDYDEGGGDGGDEGGGKGSNEGDFGCLRGFVDGQTHGGTNRQTDK